MDRTSVPPGREQRAAVAQLAGAFGLGLLLALTISGGIAGERLTRGALGRPAQLMNDVVPVAGLLLLLWAAAAARRRGARVLVVAFAGVTLYRMTSALKRAA